MSLARAKVYYQTKERSELLAIFEPGEMFVSAEIYFETIDPDIDWIAIGSILESMFKRYEECADEAEVRQWAKRFCSDIRVEVIPYV